MIQKNIKKLIVFDLDGTLVDSFPSLVDAMQSVLLARGLCLPERAVLRAQLSSGLNAMFDAARDMNAHVLAADWSTLREAYFQCYEKHHLTTTPLFKGVKSVLQGLHVMGIRLAVCTNRDRHTSHLLLSQWGLSPLISAVVSIDDMSHPKPAPQGLLDLAQGLSLAEVLFVGDSSIDCQTAQAAGVDFHAHLPGYHRSAQELQPNLLAFSDYEDWLRQLKAQGLVATVGQS